MAERRTLLLGASAGALLPALALAGAPPAATKTLRYAFPVAETTLDPVKIVDLYSRTLTPHIFEALYGYDHLARPIKIRPRTAAALPEVSADFRTWTVRLTPGIFFAADPAFKGTRRELVAQDYAYVFKRFADPANKSPAWSEVEGFGITGLAAVRERALREKTPFDYDAPVAGLQALDRHTLRFTLTEARPRFIENLTASDLYGAVAREVVEFYGEQIDAHPVGTGPFRLAQWRRSSRIVLERSPDFRTMVYDAEPAADDAEGQALLARFKGRRLPMIDRVEISIVEQGQPRWLSFVNGEADLIQRVGADFISLAMPGGHVAPNLAKRGIRGYRQLEAGSTMVLFNWESPVVGSNSPDKIALRRAFGLALDIEREITLLAKGQAIPAQSPIAPFTTGYDPAFKSEMSTYDPARANALLDLYGYRDSNGDGWREQPDGSPLVLELNTEPDQVTRQSDELLTKNLKAVGLRLRLKTAQWPENLKTARAGNYMVWRVGGLADVPDGQSALARFDSRQIGGQNMGRFRLPAFDAVYDRLLHLPDGAERNALFDQAKRIAVAYMPYKYRVNRIVTDMSYPWVVGYRRPIFWQDWWQWVDIDTALQPKA
ncbi:MAG TPA: ABC transporter substrate-binding protein [Burkholderiaceae bacterium]|jgi:ABC-type transport system substrate-binding protein